MKHVWKFILIFVILLGGCQSDLVTKHFATESLKNQPSVPVISGYLDLRYTENEAIAFSMFESIPKTIRVPVLATLQLLSSLMVCVLIFLWRRKPFFTLLPFVLILSGALGNVIDRLRFGYVVDFIHFHVQNHFSWPVFNIADVLISVGIGLVILQTILYKETPFGPVRPPEPAA